MKKVNLHLNYAGYCLADENVSIKGGSWKKIKFHALWALINHPSMGYILFDTGYTRDFHYATKSFPNKIYATITKVFIKEEEELKSQLIKNGIQPEEIKHLIISHFHADHICGLKDFPNAVFYTSKKALDQAINIPENIGFTKGILKSLIPSNIVERTVIIEEKCKEEIDEIFGSHYDLFGDSSILVYSLPGHAAGQIGIRLETEKQAYFLIADACWNKKSYTDLILPSPIVKLFFDSWSDFKSSLNQIHEFHIKNPTVTIIPTHCEKSTTPLVNDKIDFNVL